MWQIFEKFGIWLTLQLAGAAWRGSLVSVFVVAIAAAIKYTYPFLEEWFVTVGLPWLNTQLDAILPGVMASVDLTILGTYMGYTAGWIPWKFGFQCVMAYVTFALALWALRRLMGIVPGMGR